MYVPASNKSHGMYYMVSLATYAKARGVTSNELGADDSKGVTRIEHVTM